ncbi:MAG: HAD-IB family hydrolase [Parashewanella sp.]
MALRTKPRLVLFDFDGTLTTEDMFTKFIRFATPKWRIVMFGLFIFPFHRLYKIGLLPAHYLRPIVSFLAFCGREKNKVQQQGEQFSKQIIPSFLREQSLKTITKYQQRGDKVVVVSASLDIYLAPWCALHNVELLCSEMETRSTRLTGRYQQGDCSLQRKVERVRLQFSLVDYAAVHAYGDTHEDIPMIELADVAFMNWKKIH